MKNKDMIRKVFQTFTIILFIIQFQQSVRKYFDYPVVEQTSRIPVQDLPIPVVYICHPGQFNYKKAKDLGYTSFTSFLLGIHTNNTNISWKGKWENSTFKDLENILLDPDYSSTSAMAVYADDTYFGNFIEQKRTFLFPHGACIKLENLQHFKDIEIQSIDEVKIYFVDSTRANDISTGTLGAKTKMGPTSNNLFSYGSYELEYLLYDNSIHDGTSCSDYAKLDTSYGKCLSNIWTQELLATYGCLPPWVSTNNSKKICEEDITVDTKSILKSSFLKSFYDILSNLEVAMFESCLAPCKTMHIKLKETVYEQLGREKASLQARSKEWATVYTTVYSYDLLSLTVDLGSALGLWLGLSCLSILDHILENWIWMTRYWKKKCRCL